MAQRKKAQRKKAQGKKARRKSSARKGASKKRSAKKSATRKGSSRRKSAKKTTKKTGTKTAKKAAGKRAKRTSKPVVRASVRDFPEPDARAYSSFQYELSPPPSGGESAVLSVGRSLLQQHTTFVRERQRQTTRARAAAEKWRAKLIDALGLRAWKEMRSLGLERREDNYGLGPLLGNPAGGEALGQARRAFRAEALAFFAETGLAAAKIDALFAGVQRDARRLAAGAEAPQGLSFARTASSADPHRAAPFDGSTCDLSNIWILGGGEVKVEPKTEPTSGELGLSHLFMTRGDAADFEAFDLDVPCSLGFWLQPQRSGKLELDIELESQWVGGRVSACRDAPWAQHAVSQSVDWSVDVLRADDGGQPATVFESVHGPGWRRDFTAPPIPSDPSDPADPAGPTHTDSDPDGAALDGSALQLSQTDELAAFGDTLGLEVRTAKKLAQGATYYVQITTRQRHVVLLHDASLSAAMDNCWTVRSIQHNLW